MIRSKVVFCVAIVLPFLSLIAIPKAAAQSNKCEAGIGNWSYRLTDPYIKKTFPTPELRLQGISNWGELRQVGDIARRSERCDSPHHKFKVVSGVSMVMPGVFVSGEVCSDDSTLIFEQHGDESNAIAAFHSAASGSYEYNKARNALAHWYYPYHLGATQRLWNHNRERIFLYSAYLSQVCEQLPSRVRVEARTNISRGPNGPQRPTNAYTYDVIYSGEFYPNSGRIELIADDEEMEQQVFAALEEMWRSQAQQLIEFQRQLDVGFAFVALGVAGIHATSECNQFPVGHPERSPLCD
ncbi:MAG: hypothetical protein NXH70_16270 [Hyphomonas sp.]|nr:hypothetical protein [Hyphomonas sp.]